jgi:hypothetical protein
MNRYVELWVLLRLDLHISIQQKTTLKSFKKLHRFSRVHSYSPEIFDGLSIYVPRTAIPLS